MTKIHDKKDREDTNLLQKNAIRKGDYKKAIKKNNEKIHKNVTKKKIKATKKSQKCN